MCFSANASFTTSALLLLCGIVTLKRAQKNQHMLAAIPVLFALQQFCEGLVWRGLSAGIYPAFAIYSYLFFVDIVWPLWVPLSLKKISTKKSEKEALKIPIIAGSIIAIASAIGFTIPPVVATIEHHHIYYAVPLSSWLQLALSFCYLIAILVPFFIVKKKYLALMGTTLAISYLISLFFFYKYHLSVWCFFAAFISIFMFLVIR